MKKLFFVLTIFILICMISCGVKKPNVPREDPELNVNDISLSIGETYLFNLNNAIEITASNNDIISIDTEKQTITALNAGNAILEISFKYYPHIKKSITVSIEDIDNIILDINETYVFDDTKFSEILIDDEEILQLDNFSIKAISSGECFVVLIYKNLEEKEIIVTVK